MIASQPVSLGSSRVLSLRFTPLEDVLPRPLTGPVCVRLSALSMIILKNRHPSESSDLFEGTLLFLSLGQSGHVFFPLTFLLASRWRSHFFFFNFHRVSLLVPGPPFSPLFSESKRFLPRVTALRFVIPPPSSFFSPISIFSFFFLDARKRTRTPPNRRFG